MTCATIGVDLFTERAVVDAISVIVEPVGASNGIFSQAAARNEQRTMMTAEPRPAEVRVNIVTATILLP